MKNRNVTFLTPSFFEKALLLMVVAFFYFITEAHSLVTLEAIEFKPADCWLEVRSEAETDCGWLVVPERWEQRQGKTIKLSVAVFKALEPNPALAPVFYLSGGPGVAALGIDGRDIRWRREWVDTYFPGRTVVLFDQRGMGLGSPKLGCKETADDAMWWPTSKTTHDFDAWLDQLHDAITDCFDRHRVDGHDLSAFNSFQSANDIEALRQAFGFNKIILFGISYGTYLGMHVMRQHPESVEAAIFDSVLPLQGAVGGADGRIFGPALDRFFNACKENQDCNAAYPNLQDKFLRVLDALEQKPIVIDIWNQHSSNPLFVEINSRAFVGVIFEELYDIRRIPTLPTLISGLAQGEHWRLKPHVENVIYGSFPSKFDVAADLSIRCNDGLNATHQQPNLTDKIYPYLEFFQQTSRAFWDCTNWFPQKTEPTNREPLTSNTPALLLAGAFDPVTTVEHAYMAAETLSNSHVFIFPASGHVQIENSDCAWVVIDEFMTNPLTRPNPECLQSLRQPAFQTIGGN